MNIGFHPCLITVIKDNDLLGFFEMLFPFAPEQRTAGQTQDIQKFVDQVPKASF